MSLAKAKALREERTALLGEMSEISKRATDGKLSTEDAAKFQEIDAKSEELRSQYEFIERKEKLEAELRANALPPNNGEGHQPEGRTDAKEDEKRYEEAFGKFLRSQSPEDVPNDVKQILAEKRGTSSQVGTTANLGGNLIPTGMSSEIEKYMALYGGMLEVCRIWPTATGGPFTWPYTNNTSRKGRYIDQAAARNVSDTTLLKVDFPLVPTITSDIVKVAYELMQDSAFPLEGHVAELVAEAIGRFANDEFTTGSTSGKIAGFVPNCTSALTAAAYTGVTRQELVRLFHSVDPEYRNSPSCRWMFTDTTLSYIKMLTFGSGDDRPLWQPGISVGEPDRLEGKPYTVNQSMASIGTTGAKPIAFGDFSKYVIRIAKQITLSMSNERYWDEQVTGFMANARMDGRLINTNAIKVMTLA